MDEVEGVQFSTDGMEPLDLFLSETEGTQGQGHKDAQGQEHGGAKKIMKYHFI